MNATQIEKPMISTNLNAALAYVKKGWYVFPCHSIQDGKCSCGFNCSSPGKHPRTLNGFKDATINEMQISAWWTQNPDANIGVVTGKISGISVLDIDKDKGGFQSIKDYDVPATLYSQTGGGGQHKIFRYDEKVPTNAGTLASGIDFRNDGGYILVPPSNHISGNQYVWCDEDSELAFAPTWMKTNGKYKPAAPLPDVITKGQRNNLFASLAGSMNCRHASKEGMKALLMVENKRCQPPMTEDEIEGIVASISRPEYKPAPIEILAEKDAPIELVNTDVPLLLNDFLAQDIPSVEYYVTGLMQKKGKSMVSANTNVGKSIFVQNLALSIATGDGLFLNQFECAKAKVLYIDLEMGKSALKDRFEKMAKDQVVENLYVLYQPSMNLLDEVEQKRLEKWIEDTQVNVVILDPLGNAWSGDEKDQVAVSQLTAYFNRLIDKYDIALLIVHHWRKATKEFKSGGQMMAGSYRWEAWLDHHITMEGTPQSTTIACQKSRNSARFEPFLAKLDSDALKFVWLASYEKKFSEETLTNIYEQMGGGKIAVKDIVKFAEDNKICSRNTITKVVDAATLFTVEKVGRIKFVSKKETLGEYLDDPEATL